MSPLRVASFFFSAFLFFSFASSTRAQQPTNQPTKGNVTISGHVTIEGKNAANVMVVLKRGGNRFGNFEDNLNKVVAKTRTDEQGNYKLENLPRGSFRVTPQMPAYVITNAKSAYYQFGVSGKSVTLKDGDNIENMDFTMVRGCVITGRVTDGEGKPIISQKISLWSVDDKGNKTPAQEINHQRGTTDDRGVYRYYGLSAGRYIVSAGGSTGMNGRKTFYPQTFHPSTQNKDEAAIIEATSGNETSNIDIQVGAREQTQEVSGRVINEETNQPVSGAHINVQPVVLNENQFSSFGGYAQTNDRGEFKIIGLKAGQYKLHLFFFNDKTNLAASVTMIEIKDANVKDVIIKAKRGQRISGTVTIENISSLPQPTTLNQLSIAVTTQLKDGTHSSHGTANVASDGSFVIDGLQKGKVNFYLNNRQNKGFHISRIDYGGVSQKNGDIELNQDESIQGVHLHIVYGICVLRGEIKAEGGGSIPADSVVSVQLRRTDGSMIDGRNTYQLADSLNRFTVDGIPPGEYEIIVSGVQRSNNEGPSKSLFTTKQIVMVSGNETLVIVKVNINGGSQ